MRNTHFRDDADHHLTPEKLLSEEAPLCDSYSFNIHM